MADTGPKDLTQNRRWRRWRWRHWWSLTIWLRNRLSTYTNSTVMWVTTIINHPPNHHFYIYSRLFLNHSQMAGLHWFTALFCPCFTSKFCQNLSQLPDLFSQGATTLCSKLGTSLCGHKHWELVRDSERFKPCGLKTWKADDSAREGKKIGKVLL